VEHEQIVKCHNNSNRSGDDAHLSA
jgi:hypothetical protein